MKNASTILNIVTAFLLFLFLYAGLTKLSATERFEDVLRQSVFLKQYSHLLAYALPVAELSSALLLFFAATRLAGLYVVAMLLLCYTCYLGWMLLFVTPLPCNCGGLTEQISWQGQLLFTGFLFVTATATIVLFHLQSSGGKRAPPL